MSRIVCALLVTAVVITSACGPRHVAVSETRTWELRGSIESITASRIDVRHKSGRVVQLAVDDRTAIVDRSGNAPRDSLAPGMRVAVRVETALSGASRAVSVRVFN